MANLFGTLNRFISRLDAASDPNQQPAQQHRSTQGHGFQVLHNTNPSLPLEPWFDFLIGLNNHTIDSPDPSLFATEIRNSAGATISLGVYSAKGQAVREIYVTVPAEAGLGLGLALQWAPLSLTDDVWHILDVMPNSPADVAGLLPYGDYVIGSPDGELHPGDAGLGGLVEQFVDRELRLWVYNHEYDVTRLLTLTPSRHWGGEGALGCVLGYGALHRVPAPLTEPTQGPGETLFDGHDQNETQSYQPASTVFAAHPEKELPPQPTTNAGGEFFVPANAPTPITSPPPGGPPPGAGPPPGRPRKARKEVPAAGLDDYFAEGEQKSREVDNAPTPKATGGLPPPPKAGPPKAASPTPPSKAEEVETAEMEGGS